MKDRDCRACLAMLDEATPASGQRARNQIVACILNHFLFTFQFLCVTGSFESFACNRLQYRNIKYSHKLNGNIMLISFQKRKP